MNEDLSIIFYTANYISDFFMNNVIAQLKKAANGAHIISVSQKPMDLGENICLGDIGRTTYNIYKQILIGARAAKTKYVATADDDVLYSKEHFEYRPADNVFAYDINKWSLYTWDKKPIFSYKGNRRTMTSLIVTRDALVKTLEERYAKYPSLESMNQRFYEHYWGEPGRFEHHLGISPLVCDRYEAAVPSIVFSHQDAMGWNYLGSRKAHGLTPCESLEPWGRADELIKVFKQRDDRS